MRVFALSDIHVDYEENARWLANLSRSEYLNDVLILAGDISDEPSLFQRTLESLTKRFLRIVYVPGNHDLWVVRSKHSDSFEKFQAICTIARQVDVSMNPVHFGPLSIVPLHGWYDYSFGLPTESLLSSWADYHACVWPHGVEQAAITRYFAARNLSALRTVNQRVISFSHFVPRSDLIPSYVPQSVKALLPVMGSRMLENHIRWLNPDIHVYGHSHFNQRTEIDGISYINNALGYPSEKWITNKGPVCICEL